MYSTPVDLRSAPSVSLAQPHSFQLHLPCIVLCCLAAKLCPTLSPYGLQHTRFLCPSLSPGVCSNSHPLSQWCYLTIPSSAALFSFCLQSFPASESSNELAFCIKWWILKYIDLVFTLHHGEWDSRLTGYHLQYDALVELSKGCPIALSGQQLLCNMDMIGLAEPMVMCPLFHLLCCKICFLISNIQCYVGSHVIGINIL